MFHISLDYAYKDNKYLINVLKKQQNFTQFVCCYKKTRFSNLSWTVTNIFFMTYLNTIQIDLLFIFFKGFTSMVKVSKSRVKMH